MSQDGVSSCLALVPSSTGQHGRDMWAHAHSRNKGEASRFQETHSIMTIDVVKMSIAQQGSIVALLCSLPLDIVAHLFLFGDLGDYFCMGIACHALHSGIWQQPQFWVALGGPSFVDHLGSIKLWPRGPEQMAMSFRRWMFDLEGPWIQNLELLAQSENPIEMFHEALSRIQGLRQEDIASIDIWRLVHAASSAMRRISRSADCDVATSFAKRCRGRPDIFNGSQLEVITAELDTVQERVLEQQLWSFQEDDEKRNPWGSSIADLFDSKQTWSSIGGHESLCLSLGFQSITDDDPSFI